MPIIPTIIEKSQRGERAYDIYSRLLEERVIFLSGPITSEVANLIIAEILYLAARNPSQDIKIYINSPGGMVVAGLAIYDTMQHVECDISTICIGMAASMATLLLAAGAPGKRFALPNAEILLHQVAGGFEGTASDIEITARQVLKLKQKVNEILAKHTYQSIKKIEKDTDRDFYLTAEEAKDYGLIDKVIKIK